MNEFSTYFQFCSEVLYWLMMVLFDGGYDHIDIRHCSDAEKYRYLRNTRSRDIKIGYAIVLSVFFQLVKYGRKAKNIGKHRWITSFTVSPNN